MKYTSLIEGQRYLFYYTGNSKTFRATFVKTISNGRCETIIMKNRDNTTYSWSIISDLIEKIESLSEIIDILPNDILLMIDNYL